MWLKREGESCGQTYNTNLQEEPYNIDFFFFLTSIRLGRQICKPQQHRTTSKSYSLSLSLSLSLSYLHVSVMHAPSHSQNKPIQWHFTLHSTQTHPSHTHTFIYFIFSATPSLVYHSTWMHIRWPQPSLGYTPMLVCYLPSPSAPVPLHSRAEFTWWVIAAVSGRIETGWQVDTINDACSEGRSWYDGDR